jgi:hypothetical protein
VVTGTGALQDGARLGQRGRVGCLQRQQLGESLSVLGPAILERVDGRQRPLVVGQVRGRLAGGRLLAPDAEQVVVQLEGDPERPAERPVRLDDVGVVGREHSPALDGACDERRSLASDHVEIELDRLSAVALRGPDVDELAFAQGEAGLVVQARHGQYLGVAVAEVGEPMERQP